MFNLFDTQATVLRKTVSIVSDVETSTWTERGLIWVSVNHLSQTRTIVGDKETWIVTDLLSTGPDSDVLKGDKLTIEGSTFEVLSVMNRRGHHLEMETRCS